MTDRLNELRADFELQAGRSLSMPIAGVWTVMGAAALLLAYRSNPGTSRIRHKALM